VFYIKIEVLHSLRVKGIPLIILLDIFDVIIFLEFVYRQSIPVYFLLLQKLFYLLI
jgi:hypothetical protein